VAVGALAAAVALACGVVDSRALGTSVADAPEIVVASGGGVTLPLPEHPASSRRHPATMIGR
jgi:hypothetical protein